MRKLGYILLCLGFIWISLISFSMFSWISPIGLKHMDEGLPSDAHSSFTTARDDMSNVMYVAIKHALFDFASDVFHGFIIGGVLMLAGGIVLDLAARRGRSQPNTQESTP